MKNKLFFSWAFAVPVVCGSIVGATAADYFISAESVVNAINAQCSTQYEKLDYLRIGQTAMLRMCETLMPDPTAANFAFKKTIKKDEVPKGQKP